MICLWVVGVFRFKTDNGVCWEFQGIFDTYEKALAACQDRNFFVAPAKVNQVLPIETTDWEGAHYPLAIQENK